LGSNENGAPHLRQKPLVRPCSPSRLRPTGSSQRAQKRRLSGTIGLAITASDGSRAGTSGTSTSPAPRRLRVLVCARADVDRRDAPDAPDATDGVEVGALVGGCEADGVAAPADAAPADAAPADAAPAGAIPHTSQ
jgi:hypothetical protein